MEAGQVGFRSSGRRVPSRKQRESTERSRTASQQPAALQPMLHFGSVRTLAAASVLMRCGALFRLPRQWAETDRGWEDARSPERSLMYIVLDEQERKRGRCDAKSVRMKRVSCHGSEEEGALFV